MRITTNELDDIARPGLARIKAMIDGDLSEETAASANATLKVLRVTNGRMSAETNRLAVGVRIAKAANIPPQDQRVLWDQLIGATVPVVQAPQEALAPTESAASGQDTADTGGLDAGAVEPLANSGAKG